LIGIIYYNFESLLHPRDEHVREILYKRSTNHIWYFRNRTTPYIVPSIVIFPLIFFPFFFSLGWRRRWGRILSALSLPIFWFEAVMITDIHIFAALSFSFLLGSNALMKWPITEFYRTKFNSSPKPRNVRPWDVILHLNIHPLSLNMSTK